LLFGSGRWLSPRGGHLGGNRRERQPNPWKLRFLVTAKPVAGIPCGFLTGQKRDRDGALTPAAAFEGRREIDPARAAGSKGLISVPLVGAIGPDAYSH
jgi:hypothetical protein